MNVEFIHDLGTVGFDGLGAQIVYAADAFHGAAFGDHLEHLILSGGQLVQTLQGSAAFKVTGDHCFRYRSREPGVAVNNGIDGFSSVTSLTASLPSAASPTTSTPGISLSRATIPARTRR